MVEYIKELIGESWIKVRVGGYISQSKQTNLGIPQGGVFSVTLFLVVDRSLLVNNLAIYITTRSQRVASRALQEVINKLDACSRC